MPPQTHIQQQEIFAQVVKNGETAISVTFDRPIINDISKARYNVRVIVKASPTVEAFIKSLGNETLYNIGEFSNGDSWRPALPGQELKVWACDPGDALENAYYNMNGVNSPLVDINGSGATNLSFLRLQGISNPEGVTFLIKGVFGKAALRAAKEDIEKACRHLYVEYIRPMVFQTNLIVGSHGEVDSVGQEARF